MAVSTIPMTTNNSGHNAVNGYCKTPDGTLIQWGRVRFAPPETTGLELQSVAFMEEFIDTNIAVTVSWNDLMTNMDPNVGLLGVDTVTTTNVRFGCVRKTTTGNWYAKFIAIGRWK